MGQPLTQTIDGHEFKISALPFSIAVLHAPRAAGHMGAIGLSVGEGKGGMLRALGERFPASEVQFFTDLLFPRIEVDGKPLKVAMDAGLVKGGMPTIWKVLIAAMDLSFGPFGDLADSFGVLRQPSAEEQGEPEPSPTSG